PWQARVDPARAPAPPLRTPGPGWSCPTGRPAPALPRSSASSKVASRRCPAPSRCCWCCGGCERRLRLAATLAERAAPRSASVAANLDQSLPGAASSVWVAGNRPRPLSGPSTRKDDAMRRKVPFLVLAVALLAASSADARGLLIPVEK